MRKYFKAFKDIGIFDKQLIIIAHYPPPPGGAGVHVQRLEPLLVDNGIGHVIFNQGFHAQKNVHAIEKKAGWWASFFLYTLINRRKIRNSGNLFHFHLFTWLHYPYLFLFSRLISDRLLITVHNEDLLKYGRLRMSVTLQLQKFTNCKARIAVSYNLNEFLNEHGIESVFLPAYLPPQRVKKKRLADMNKENGVISIATNMWRFNRPQINRYGIDLLFRLLRDYEVVLLRWTVRGRS